MTSNALGYGTTLQEGKYSIIKVLGWGGFGITYLAEQPLLNRMLAIKEFFMREYCVRGENAMVLTLAHADMVERYRKKFFNEARLVAQQNHPGIVKVIDIFEENDTAYEVMEYIEGESLLAMVKEKGMLSEPTALRYVIKVAEALGFLHHSYVNHLDVKPANIMVRREDDMPILVDFGMSKQYDEKEEELSDTLPGVCNGYSPLEQYSPGGVSKFSPQADIYALGATLYKLLTGNTPPIATDVMNNGLPPLPATISPGVRKAIEQAMQFRIADRPKSMGEFIKLLVMGMAPVGGAPLEDEDEMTVIPPEDFEVPAFEDEMPQAPSQETFNGNLTVTQQAVIDRLVGNMARVEGGTFMMGAAKRKSILGRWVNSSDDLDAPAHEVKLSSFSIARYAVTQEEWEAVMGDNPSEFKDAKRPVENVSWNDCQVFIKKLNTLTGCDFRLPTEAEWEFAASGGNSSQRYKYAGSNEVDLVAWFTGNAYDKGASSPAYGTHPVGRKYPNELGLYDMSGNVCEWCGDWYGDYKTSSQDNPSGPSSGSLRVVRGGNWTSYAEFCRVSYRNKYSPNVRSNFIGLRLAR